ncbi:MAG: glycosyltransferase [Armatimonadota bacterium]
MHGDRKPHIVHISNRTMPGGAQMSTLRLIQSSELSGFRHSVVCVHNAAHGPLEELYRAAGAAVVYCPIPPVRLRPYRLWRRVSRALFALRLLRVLRALQPDAVHSQTPAGLDVQGRTVRALGLPWVVSFRELVQGVDRHWLAAQRFAQQGPTAVVAVSEAVRESLKRSGFTHPVRVIYNGIDLRPYLECRGGCRPPRRNSGVPENSIVFGTCARVAYVKGIDVLVEAAHCW